jgi:integrase
MATVRKRTWESGGVTRQAWVVDYADRQGKRHWKTFRLKRDADAALIKIQGEVQAGTHTPASNSITLREACEVWYKHNVAEGLEASTLRNYRGQLDRYLIPLLGRVRLAQLTTPRVALFRDELLQTSTRPMARKIVAMLKNVLAQAQERGLVGQNVALSVKFKDRDREKRNLEVGTDIPSREEIRTLIAAATGRFRPFLVTAVYTGMRASELRGLRWSDVDLDKKTVTVKQRADRFNVLGMPKSKAGQRTIPLSPTVLNTLREWRLKCPKPGTLNLVFPTQVGTPQLHGNIANLAFYPLQRKTGIVSESGGAKYGLHSLRHFCASHWIDSSIPVKKVQTWLGHASIKMTMDVYGHLMSDPVDDHDQLAAAELRFIG